MTVQELIDALDKVKDKSWNVILTDTHGSFNVDILTVEADEEQVIIVAEPHPSL